MNSSSTTLTVNADQEAYNVNDGKEVDKLKKSSTKQDGTLAFLRQCILELKAGISSIFSSQEEELQNALWSYLMKTSKKTEIQKQPKKKIKFLFIPCLDEENIFGNLNLEMSNIIRSKCYFYIRSKIESNQFEQNFLIYRNYGKTDKKRKELTPIDAEKKILNTLIQYYEELRKPSRFRGLYSDANYTPDLEWIQMIELKNTQKIFFTRENLKANFPQILKKAKSAKPKPSLTY